VVARLRPFPKSALAALGACALLLSAGCSAATSDADRVPMLNPLVIEENPPPDRVADGEVVEVVSRPVFYDRNGKLEQRTGVAALVKAPRDTDGQALDPSHFWIEVDQADAIAWLAKAKGQPIRVYFYEREGARWIQGIAQDAAQPLVTIHHVESEQALPQLPAEAAGE